MEEKVDLRMAPDLDEIEVLEDRVTTVFNGLKIEYVFNRDNIYDKTVLKTTMRSLIAMTDRKWQMEEGFNNYLGNKEGKVTITKI